MDKAFFFRVDALSADGLKNEEHEAAAIQRVNEALAASLKLLNEACPNDQVIKLKALEAFRAAADGRATKIIIPSEIQGLAGLAEGVFETVKRPEAPKKPATPTPPAN